jgi:hypothetical protein
MREDAYPVVVRESAPMTTPPSNSQAMMVVCNNKTKQEVNFSVFYTQTYRNPTTIIIHLLPSNVVQSSSPACLEQPVSSTNSPSLASTNPLIIQVLRIATSLSQLKLNHTVMNVINWEVKTNIMN